MRRLSGLAGVLAWLVIGQALVALPAFAQTCIVPGQRPTIQAAVADPTCQTVLLGATTYGESVQVERAVVLQGLGPASSVIAGRVVVASTGVLELIDLRIDVADGLAGCFDVALDVAAGGQAILENAWAFNAGAPAALCPLFANGFELP